MTRFGYCYDEAGSKCSGKVLPGTANLRAVVDELIPEAGDLGAYNCRPKRTSSKMSLHGVGRAWDLGTSTLAFNAEIAEFLVAVAPLLGIQRVIAYGKRVDGTTGPREWDSRVGERVWERYSGPSHKDHNHIELCKRAAAELTRAEVRAAIQAHWRTTEEVDAVFYLKDKKLYQVVGPSSVRLATGRAGTRQLKALEAAGVKIYTGKQADDLAKAFPVAA